MRKTLLFLYSDFERVERHNMVSYHFRMATWYKDIHCRTFEMISSLKIVRFHRLTSMRGFVWFALILKQSIDEIWEKKQTQRQFVFVFREFAHELVICNKQVFNYDSSILDFFHPDHQLDFNHIFYVYCPKQAERRSEQFF